MEVRLDGMLVKTIDLYSSRVQWQQLLFEKTGLSESWHSLLLTVTTKHNTKSTGYRAYIDAFEALS